MKTKRRRHKALLSILLILSMLLSYVPPGGIVHAAPLTQADTIQDQKVWGFTYTENGETRRMYLYQSEDGKVKLTGDILFTTSSYGYYQVRHYDGYLELKQLEGVQIKQAILVQHGELYTGDSEKAQEHGAFMDLRILDEYGSLWSFNAEMYEPLTELAYDVQKIDDVFYLDEYGDLGAIAPNTPNLYNTDTNTYGKRYWHDYRNLAGGVEDFLVIGSDQEVDPYGERAFTIPNTTQLYIEWSNGTQGVRAIRRSDYDGEYSLAVSALAIPSVDDTTNTLTVENILRGIDRKWVFLQTGPSEEEILSDNDLTSSDGDSETYTVMDGHVTITFSGVDTSLDYECGHFTKLTIQSDSSETVSFDGTTGTIHTGYQDIKLYSPFSSQNYVFEYAQPIGYEEWRKTDGNDAVVLDSGERALATTDLGHLLGQTATKIYGKLYSEKTAHGPAGSDQVDYYSEHWRNSNVTDSSIYNERETGDHKYNYDTQVTLIGNRSENHIGTTYPGFAFTDSDNRTITNSEIGEGLQSDSIPPSLAFTVYDDDGNAYNHILNFKTNRHSVYKNHYKSEEYPMNFKEGETDNPYVYTTDTWQLTIYAKHTDATGTDRVGDWRPVYEFTYAPSVTTGTFYPEMDIYMETAQGIDKPLPVDDNTGKYYQPSSNQDYDVWFRSNIKNISFGDTEIVGASLDSSFDGSTPIYDMSGGKCVYRVADYTNNNIVYDVMEDGKLYRGTSGHSRIAENVVKVESSGKYLTVDGELFDRDGTKLKENVTNITDDLYQSEDGKWRHISSDEEFKFDAADEHNLKVTRSYEYNGTSYDSVTYQFEYGDDIVSVVDEDGEEVPNYEAVYDDDTGEVISEVGTRTYTSNGTHTFTITNKYGDTYTKRIITTGFVDGVSASDALATVVNGKVTLTGPDGTTLQYKKESDTDWTDYTEAFDYEEPILYRAGENGSIRQATLDTTTGELTVIDLSAGSSLTANDYFVNAVWDGNNMHYYDSANNSFDDTTLGYLYPKWHNGGGSGYGPNDDFFKYTLTTNAGTGPYYVKPIYGFIGEELADNAIIMTNNPYTEYNPSNKYSSWKNIKRQGMAMPYLGNFSLLVSAGGSNISPASEDVIDNDTQITNTLDTNHMLNMYGDATDQNVTFIKAFMDGVYNWLVTDTGQILRSVASVLVGNQYKMDYAGFILEEVADDVTSVNEDYIIETESGDGPIFGYGKDNAHYYLNSAIEANGGNVDGAEESGDTIVASSGTGMNRRALASNGNYYVALDDVNMVSYDSVTTGVNQLDYEVSTTNWTNEFVTTTPSIGSTFTAQPPYGTHWMLYKTDHPDGDFGIGGDLVDNPSRGLYNGDYRFDLVDNQSSTVLATAKLAIKNVDTIKPTVTIAAANGKYTFSGEDQEGIYDAGDGDLDNDDDYRYRYYSFNGAESAVSGIENVYYSLDGNAGLDTYAVLNKPVTYVPAGEETGATDVIEITDPVIYVYAKDNAGNISDVKTVNLGMTLTPTITYKNGETDLSFYADDDSNHDNANYDYSYTIDTTETDGYEKTFTDDANVTIAGTYEDTANNLTLSVTKNVPIIVLKPGKPTISDIDTLTRSVTVTAGTPAHMTFKELWVKVDDGEFTKYTDQTKVITFTDYGYHTIKAYQVAENTELAGGPYTFQGEEVEKTVEDPEPVTIYHTYQYEKGKTTVTFYANTDTNNDDDRWTYKYTVEGGTQTDGYTFFVTEDTTAALFAEVDNGGLKSNGTKNINIYVMDAEKPQISDIPKNGNKSTITAGEIENDTLKTLEYKIDDATTYTTINSGDEVEVPVGWHTIYAKQTTNGGIVTENERRVYAADLDITHKIKHHNGYTELTFEDKDPEKNPDLTYTHDDTPGKGVVTDTPITVHIKETDPQGNDDEDTVDLDIVKTETPIISVENDKLKLVAGDIENGTLIKMYYSFDNQNFEPYENPVDLDMDDVTVYTYQTVKPDAQFDDNDIVTSDTAQADIFKYDVEFVDDEGTVIADGYSHVVLAGTSVTENAKAIDKFAPREPSITKVIDEPGIVLSFVYDGNPVDVTIYHLDAESNNAELARDTLSQQALRSVITATERKKSFVGYTYKNADPATLVVTNDTKEMRLYYEYASFDYVVHYVDKDGQSVAPDKQASAKFRANVTETAIEVANYELDDDAQKQITIKADSPNEITFKYKKVIPPRSATISGSVTNDDGDAVVNGTVTLTKKKGLIDGILSLFNDDAPKTAKTDANGNYGFANVETGEYELAVSDDNDKSLAKATITVSKTGEEANDNIEVTFKGEHVTTHDAIEGNNFIVNVGQTSIPVTVTVYHLDATNNNIELAKEELPDVELNSIIRSSEHVKAFTGYVFKNAEPEALTVTKTAKEMRLYYEYDSFDYIVHYVDESNRTLAPDKTGNALFKSLVTERAIPIENYEPADVTEKSITIEANVRNEITFVYKKTIAPRSAKVSGHVTDDDGEPVVGGIVTLTQHTGLVEDVLTPISGVANETTTNAEGYYEFANVPAGEHELEVSDPEQTSLAKATINVSKTGEEVNDNIEITFRGDHVTTHDAIEGDNFIVNVGQTSKPVTVTVYHLDAENNNAELDKDEISNTEIGTIINAEDHIKQFEGYAFRDADPEILTVTKTDKEIRLYYIYDEFDYTVHYVDEDDELIAEDKTGKALFNSEVIEQAIEIEGYELNDDDEKSIVIKADKPNEITFKYKAVKEGPRAVSIVGQAKDKGTTPIVNRVVILKQKTNLLGAVVNFFTDNAETVLKTDEEGKYRFENVSAGFYELAIYDVEDEKDVDEKNLLASAEINVGEKHEEADDLITVVSAAEFVTPYQNITGDMFIFDIDRTILSAPAPEAPVIRPPAPEIIPAPEVVENPPIFYMYKEIVLKKKNTFTINLQGIDKNTTVTSKITGKSAKAKKVVSIKQKKNGNVVITPKKLGKTQVTCTVLKNDVVYQVVVNIKVLKQYKGTSKNFNLKSSALMKTTGDLPEFNVYKRIVKGKKTQIKFTKVATNAKVKFYVANKKEKKILKIGKIKRKGSTATCTIRGKKKGWAHLTAKITQNGQTYYTRILVRIDDRSCEKEEISKQIHKYLE